MEYLWQTGCLLTATYFLFIILRWAYQRYQNHKIFVKLGIPGPKPNFLTGNMTHLKAAQTPNDVITKWLNEYGPVFGYFIGEMPYLVMRDLEMIKQVMVKDFQCFPNRADMFLEVKPLMDTVLALKNQRWKEVRSVLTPTFSASKIKLMTKIMNKKVATTVEVVEERSKKGEMFDIYTVVQALTLDVIAECALAMKVNCQKDNKDQFLLAAQNFFRYAHNSVVEYAIMFPFISTILAFISHYVTAGKMTTMIVNNVTEAIKYRRTRPDIRRMDLLQLMLDSANTNSDNSSKKSVQLTDDEVIANAYIFLLAGYETTGTALALTFWLLIHHPEIQEKLYEEISKNCTEDEMTYERIQSMHYLDQVFTESLRIYPPVTGFISRKCEIECEVGKYTIPPGVTVLAPIWDIQHDPELWPDPWKFDPDRFSKENKSGIQNLSYFPFGIGPRNCIGMRFAQLEAKLALVQLIRKFKFIPCEKTENPLTFICPTVIINPSKGVYLKAIPREIY